MEQPITLIQLLLTALVSIIVAVAPQVYNIYAKRRDSLDKQKELEMQRETTLEDKKLSETDKLYREWDNIVKQYVTLIESQRHLETENAQLRPLVLRNALIQQENKQLKDDKEDWKDYALKLVKQLEDANLVPIPFMRVPRDEEDTQEKIKTVSRKMKAISDAAQNGGPVSSEAPTITVADKIDIEQRK